MELQPASSAKTSSDNVSIKERSVLSSLTMTIINSEITKQSTRTDLDCRTYKAELTFYADTNDGTKPVQIIQSDSSHVLLVDIESALNDAGYRISSTVIKSSRTGVNDKVKLQVAWD